MLDLAVDSPFETFRAEASRTKLQPWSPKNRILKNHSFVPRESGKEVFTINHKIEKIVRGMYAKAIEAARPKLPSRFPKRTVDRAMHPRAINSQPATKYKKLSRPVGALESKRNRASGLSPPSMAAHPPTSIIPRHHERWISGERFMYWKNIVPER